MDFDRDFGVNQVFVEDQYERWRDNPAAVDLDWQQYFSRLAGLPAPQPAQTSAPPAPAPARDHRAPHADLLPHYRGRVHARRGPGHPPLAAGADGGDR